MKVIYHGNCTDGFTAAWVAWTEYGDAAEYIPAQYGDEPPDVVGHDVLILDFSYPRDVLERLHAAANTLLVLDHHKTAEESLRGLPFAQFDMDRSGAGMAWDELRGGPRPSLVDYVEDRDLWRWRLPQSREISAYISSWPREFGNWEIINRVLTADSMVASVAGGAVLRCTDRYVDGRCANPPPLAIIGGHEVPCLNSTHAISELAGKLAEAHLFAACWFQRDDGKFVYSLRSRGDFDVSAVAKQYGGGGHKGAAGFTVDALLTPVTRAAAEGGTADAL